MRLVDADALKRHEQKLATQAWKMKIKASVETVLNQFIDDIDHAPTVDAVPVKHGRWKAVTDDGDEYIRICSCCGEEAPYDESEDVYLIYPYCPWCGAEMDGKDGERHD